MGGGAGGYGIKIEGGKKNSSSLEEEMVRTRTRFSVFELWHANLVERKAIGRFEGWDLSVLDGLDPGDTVEMRAQLKLAPLVTLFKQYLWFAEQARTQNTMFSQSGDELKATKEAERNIRALFGTDDNRETWTVFAYPGGEGVPSVAMQLSPTWVIGHLDHLAGYYSVVAQVDRILGEEDELPTLRITREAPATPLELKLLRDAVGGFLDPAKAMGLEVSEDDAGVRGPAVWLTPIAIYR
jgi:hypothetical protein